MIDPKSRFAIFLIVGDVEGGGGVERLYINYILYNQSVDIITTSESKNNILKLCPNFPQKNIKTFKALKNRFNHFFACFQVLYLIKSNRYSLIHIANFDSYFEPLYRYMASKVKLSLNIIDCRFEPEFNESRYTTIKKFISSDCLSGIFSWYQNPENRIKQLNKSLYFKAASVCFTDYQNFKPADKKNIIVFAARLSATKRVEHYLKAVKFCLQNSPKLFSTWEFLLWGNGEMRESIDSMLIDLGIEKRIKLGYSKDMSEIFNQSAIFVSTQMYENFTSLSMLEAMGSGNAIISYDLGQTSFFVKDGVNGILVKEEKPEFIAKAMEVLVSSSEKLKAYQTASSELARNTHNVEIFSHEFLAFIQNIIES